MPTKPSEAATETSQVEAKPSESEEEQVVAAEPSEEAKPVQEEEKPAQEVSIEEQLAKLSDEEVEALPDTHPVKRLAKSIADKSALKLRQEYEARSRADQQRAEDQRRLQEAQRAQQERQTVYRQLQVIKRDKPEEWAKHMDNPEYASIWAEGGSTMPSTEEVDRARAEGANTVYGSVYQGLMGKPEMANLTDKDLERLDVNKFRGQPNAQATYLGAMCEVLAEKLAEARIAKLLPEKEAAAEERGAERVRNEYREAGVGPPVIEGKTTPGQLTKEKYEAMTADERANVPDAEIDAMYARERGV